MNGDPTASSGFDTFNTTGIDSVDSSLCPSPSAVRILDSSQFPAAQLNYPFQMRQRLREITFSGDPLLVPIQSNELAFLVRSLYKLSSYLNERVRLQANFGCDEEI